MIKVLNRAQTTLLDPNYDLISINMARRLSFSDAVVLPLVYKNFIQSNKIAFNLCAKCWNDTQSFSVQLVRIKTLVDASSTRVYEYWFAVVFREPVTGLQIVASLGDETEFLMKMTAGMAQLVNTINAQISLFTDNSTLQRVANVGDAALRRYIHSLFFK